MPPSIHSYHLLVLRPRFHPHLDALNSSDPRAGMPDGSLTDGSTRYNAQVFSPIRDNM